MRCAVCGFPVDPPDDFVEGIDDEENVVCQTCIAEFEDLGGELEPQPEKRILN